MPISRLTRVGSEPLYLRVLKLPTDFSVRKGELWTDCAMDDVAVRLKDELGRFVKGQPMLFLVGPLDHHVLRSSQPLIRDADGDGRFTPADAAASTAEILSRLDKGEVIHSADLLRGNQAYAPSRLWLHFGEGAGESTLVMLPPIRSDRFSWSEQAGRRTTLRVLESIRKTDQEYRAEVYFREFS